MSNATTTPRQRLLTLVAVVSLGLAACGADETIDAGAIPGGELSEDSTAETLPDETLDDTTSDTTEAVSEGFTAMTPRTDLVSLQSATPAEVLLDPANDARVLIRFEGAAEPCSGAAVTLTETDTDVTVLLETGLDPNAAAMSCIAMTFNYEIAVDLDASLGERSIIIG